MITTLFIDAEELSFLTGTTPRTVRRWISAGMIKATRGKKWQIERGYALRIAPLLNIRSRLIHSIRKTHYE